MEKTPDPKKFSADLDQAVEEARAQVAGVETLPVMPVEESKGGDQPDAKQGGAPFFSGVNTKITPFSWDKKSEPAADPAKPEVKAMPAEVPSPSKQEVSSPTPEPKPENIQQLELDKAITDFEAKQKLIAETRAKKTGRFASLAKSLGIKTRNLDEDPEILEMEKESHDLYRNLLSKGIHQYKGDKPQLEKFLQQYDEFEVFKRIHNEEIEQRGEVAGIPEKYLAGMHKIGKKWSELKTWQKIAIGASGGALMAGGAMAIGAGTFGAATLTAGWRWGFRGFGAMAAGVGRKMQLDKKMTEEMEKSQEGVLQAKLDILKRWGDNLDEGIEELLAKSPGLSLLVERSFNQRSLDNNRRARNLALKSFAISSIVGESLRASGISMSSVIRKIGGYVGFGGGMTQQAVEQIQPSGGVKSLSHEDIEQIQKSLENVPSGGHAEDLANKINEAANSPMTGAELQPSEDVLYTHDAEGKISGLTTFGEEHFKEMSIESHDSVPQATGRPNLSWEKYNEMNTLNVAPEIEANVSEPAVGRPNLSWDKYNEMNTINQAPETDVQTPEIEKPKSILLGVDDVKKGGGIEKSAKAIIKANAREYGLDPSDPNLNTKAGHEAHKLAREMANKMGLTYKEFNEIASHKVDVGDTIRIYNDPVSGSKTLLYNGPAFDEAISPDNVPDAEVAAPKMTQASAAEEIVSNKPKLAVEDVKPKAAAEHVSPKAEITDHHEAQPKGKIPGMDEIEARQRIAQEDFAKANQYQRDLAEYHAGKRVELENISKEAIRGQFLPTKALLNRVVEGAGISGRANFWDGSAQEWYDQIMRKENYMAQDVINADAVKSLNENDIRLKAMFKRFGKPQLGMSMNEYLLKIVANSRNIPILNTLISGNIEKLIGHPIK